MLLCCPSCKLRCSRASTTMSILPRTVGESLQAETFGVFGSLFKFRRDRLQQIFFREKEKDFHRRLGQGWMIPRKYSLGHTFLYMAQGRSIELTLQGGFYKSLGGGGVADHLRGVACAQRWLGCDLNLSIFMLLLQFDMVRCSYAQQFCFATGIDCRTRLEVWIPSQNNAIWHPE